MMQYEIMDILKSRPQSGDYSYSTERPIWEWNQKQKEKMSSRVERMASFGGKKEIETRKELENRRFDDKKKHKKEVFTGHYTKEVDYECQWDKCGSLFSTKCKLKPKI